MTKKKSNKSAIRTDKDKEVARRNRAIYSATDPTSGYPKGLGLISVPLRAGAALFNPDEMQYEVTDAVADAAWRKRLGLSYDDKLLIENKDGSYRLPKNIEMEIPTDTTFIKNRIAANKKLANQSNIMGDDWKLINSMIDLDNQTLDALRRTYKTGEPVVINEYSNNSRRLANNGELIEGAHDYKTPLNVLQNYTIQYDPKSNSMKYRDTYDFNGFESFVPGEPFEISGSIPLNKYSIGGWFKNTTASLGKWNTGITDKLMGSKFGQGLSNLGIKSGGLGGIANTAATAIGGLLAGKNKTGVGSAMQTIGSLASNIPGVGGLIGAGVNMVGGLVNAAFGSNINKEFVNQTESQARQQSNFVSNAFDNASLLSDWDSLSFLGDIKKSDVGSDGWFSNKAGRETDRLNTLVDEANMRALASLSNTAENIDKQNDLMLMANYNSYGGPIDMKYTGIMSPFGNQFDKGGHKESGIPTQEEYIAQQIAAKRVAALDKSRNRTSVRIPMVPNKRPIDVWEGLLNNDIEYAEESLSRAMAEGNKKLAALRQEELDSYLKEKDAGYPKLVPGANCMYNAGDCYGLNIPGNQTFVAKHKELGFKKAPKGSMEPGDIVQDVRGGTPIHAMIYDSKDAEGNLLFNYARGNGYADLENGYVKQGDYPLPIKDFDVYKYVGTPADSTQWINEYKEMYNNKKAEGGNLFTNGVTFINNGDTHENNPLEGVRIGVDENNIPNLVEEGEVIYNDYVFSNRLRVPKEVSQKYKLRGVTFADAAKQLQKESEERPNDPISKKGLEASMKMLMSEQEMIRSKKEGNKYATGGDIVIGEEEKVKPMKTSWLRYAPIVGSGISVLNDWFGGNEPDYSNANMFERAIEGTNRPVRARQIGNYLTYRPFDRDYYINKLNADAAAGRRAIVNTSGGNRAAAMAGILASDYNYGNQLGALARQAEEYNLAQRQAVEQFNRGTNVTNAEMAMKADLANAEQAMQRAKMYGSLAEYRDSILARNRAEKSANLTNFIQGLGDLGTELTDKDKLRWLAELGVLKYDASGKYTGDKKSNERAKGGRITRKKRGGFTI